MLIPMSSACSGISFQCCTCELGLACVAAWFYSPHWAWVRRAAGAGIDPTVTCFFSGLLGLISRLSSHFSSKGEVVMCVLVIAMAVESD